MDFAEILSVAQKNEHNKRNTSYYQTKFTPPKKESKQSKVLSQNIKKFLARKEEEDRMKMIEEKRKKQKLLALRDQKANSRISKHLKVCKSANKSVLKDAIDIENTAITMAGPSQPDEDDYGYVSHEASDFYNKLMNKYNSQPAEKPLFESFKNKGIKDIASTKDRVKQALKQQELEDSHGGRRKKKSSSLTESEQNSILETEVKEDKAVVEDEKKGKKLKHDRKPPLSLPPPPPPPLPPMDFSQLLKLAEKKQHEPIMVEVKPKQEEPERLLTKKQMKEYTRENKSRDKKYERQQSDCHNSISKVVSRDVNKLNGQRDSKTGGLSSLNNIKNTTIGSIGGMDSKSFNVNEKKKLILKSVEKSGTVQVNGEHNNRDREAFIEERKKLELEKRKLEQMRRDIEREKKKLSAIKSKHRVEMKSGDRDMNGCMNKVNSGDVSKLVRENDMRYSRLLAGHERVKLNSSEKSEPTVKKIQKLPRPLKRRKILDDDDEHDSELDDFIDDEPGEEMQDYSKYISEIFGYDKSKYRNVDDDDCAMESNFAQQLKEEYVSTKIGIMEDLEDIRKEAIEKKQKALIKRKRKI